MKFPNQNIFHKAPTIDGLFRVARDGTNPNPYLYRIGKLLTFDSISKMGKLEFTVQTPDGGTSMRVEEFALDSLRPCTVLPNTVCQVLLNNKEHQGIILQTAEHAADGITYYWVATDEKIHKVAETALKIYWQHQDPHPLQMLADYEFYHPLWKQQRDSIMSLEAQVKSTSYGVSELLGSRIHLLAHQADVVSQVLTDEECRYILADEVGLGKTIEACVILKNFYQRKPSLKTLIVVPASLLRQWYYELGSKFWLDFWIREHLPPFKWDGGGLLISHETLDATDREGWHWLLKQPWDMVIVDEAHQLKPEMPLYKRIKQLSLQTKHLLLLSATPIQRRSQELLNLLKLVNPSRYDAIDYAAFQELLGQQQVIREFASYYGETLTPESFYLQDFVTGFEQIRTLLHHDPVLQQLGVTLNANIESPSTALTKAREIMAYLSRNYRVESRMIRNRRKSLQGILPQRELNLDYAYQPDEVERAVIDHVHDYANHILSVYPDSAVHLAYARLLFRTCFSSPDALCEVLDLRRSILQAASYQDYTSQIQTKLTSLAHPRHLNEYLQLLLQVVKPLEGELSLLDELLPKTKRWQDAENQAAITSRSGQVLQYIQQAMAANPDTKFLIFSTWVATLERLKARLQQLYGTQTVAEFHATIEEKALQGEVQRFQEDSGCRIMLCDELGGEGRNFQIADCIIHMDLPWTPAQLEQRIGRVDRIGRTNPVISLVPYACDTLEADLFAIWHEAFNLFQESMSGMEIVMETVQDDLAAAFQQDTRYGLQDLLPRMREEAEQLRIAVEDERYFEQIGIRYERRHEFQQLQEQFADSDLIREPILNWAKLTKLKHTSAANGIFTLYPQEFDKKHLSRLGFILPKQTNSSKRLNFLDDKRIMATFNRSEAMQREYLKFFAVGSQEAWMRKFVEHIEASFMGRICGIERPSHAEADVLELLFTVRLNAESLYQQGIAPAHLYKVYPYLGATTLRLFVDLDGQILPADNPLVQTLMQQPYQNSDKHLGGQSEGVDSLVALKQRFPPNVWQDLLQQVWARVEAYLAALPTMVRYNEAQQDFQQLVLGRKAAAYWQSNILHENTRQIDIEIAELERVHTALLDCLKTPQWRLESLCYWSL
jgi:ATP-dependent helicase HepA